MKVYIDSDFKCHVTSQDNYVEVNDDFFDNKCDTFIEGYRYVPAGATWISADGTEFPGVMISPWKNYNELAHAQLAYTTAKLSETPTTEEITTAIQEGVNSI